MRRGAVLAFALFTLVGLVAGGAFTPAPAAPPGAAAAGAPSASATQCVVTQSHCGPSAPVGALPPLPSRSVAAIVASVLVSACLVLRFRRRGRRDALPSGVRAVLLRPPR